VEGKTALIFHFFGIPDSLSLMNSLEYQFTKTQILKFFNHSSLEGISYPIK
jgi:hypothetical protein